MNFNLPTGQQPSRTPWPMDCLLRERAIALGNTIEPSTLRTYNSALTSYLTFVRAHNLSTTPSEDTLSFYIVYMSHHISPRSVTTYLSGIVQQLEPFYPLIRDIRNSKLVHIRKKHLIFRDYQRLKALKGSEDLKTERHLKVF